MAKETLHMKVGPLISEHLLEIVQTNISNGNIEYAMSVYPHAFGMTKEHALMILKNKAVVITDEDGEGVRLCDDENLRIENMHNILDWQLIIDNRITDLLNTIQTIHKTANDFMKVYRGNIEDYSIMEMMLRYFSHDELSTIGIHNIAARIIGSPNCKICDNGSSNPTSIWERLEGKMENYEDEPDIPKYEKVLYYTIKYNKLIRLLHKEYLKFENTYVFLLDNGFINKPSRVEHAIEMAVEILWKFSDTSTGYCHPLCNTGLYDYKTHLAEDVLKTKFGKEFVQVGIIQKDIMDGYDAGWLSPDGEFYGANGETSSMIHMNIAEQIFNGSGGKYAIAMAKDGVSIMDINSPEQWLTSHGWIKIHHNDCYGSFIGRRDETPTKDYPYPYCPTEVQIKMICDYIDKYYNGKFYTEANAFGRVRHTEPFTTYKVRQMDEFRLHEIFGY